MSGTTDPEISKVAHLYIGLPGSGKTTVMQAAGHSLVVDDCCNVADLFVGLAAIAVACNVGLADPRLCLPDTLAFARSQLLQAGFAVVEYYWENDPDAAAANLAKRNDGRKIWSGYVQHLSRRYCPPRVDFKIYRGNT